MNSFEAPSTFLLPHGCACDKVFSVERNGATMTNHDEQFEDATQYYLEKGLTEQAARQLAGNSVDGNDDDKAADDFEAAQ